MTDRLMRAFVRDFVRDRATFVSKIHDNDEMLLWNLGRGEGPTSDPHVNYQIIGRRILSDLSRIVGWAFDGFAGVGAMLDFASGYGRLTRHLVQELPADRIWVSDIQEEAVRFQEETFGVHGIVSAYSPQDLSCDQRFDLVFVASLFSHLPDEVFEPWLKRLYHLLTERGVLVISVHDMALTAPDSKERGISFISDSESERLDPDFYGTSYVSEAYVARAVESVTRRRGAYRRIPKGLCDYQDLYVVTRPERDDLSDLDTSAGLVGFVDNRFEAENVVTFSGWAHDFSPHGDATEVQALVNGRVVDRCAAVAERADVAAHFSDPSAAACGWSVSLPFNDLSPTDAVALKAVSDCGRELLLLFEPVEMLLPGGEEE